MSYDTPPFNSDAVPSAQSVFDEVVGHLMRQGAPARKSTYGACLYRSEERKCAVGFLISDEAYTPEMEERGICDLLDNFENVLPKYFSTHKDLLVEAIAIAFRHKLEWMEAKFQYGKYKKAPVIGRDLEIVPAMAGEPS